MPEPSPRRAPGAPFKGKVLLRRRKADWGGAARDGADDPVFAAQRIALATASDTLAEEYALTATHSDDVVSLSDAIAERLGVSGGERESILTAAALHDIGKVTVPPEVIDKPGPLASDEWEVMRRHTLAGEQIIRSVPDMDDVARLVRSSHERWDGAGYPDGLAGDEIPLGSRIIFCADAFHAIRCDRPYRQGKPALGALAEVRENAGGQFDPQVVAALDEVARTLRSSRVARVRALAGGLHSRRAAVLLLALAVGGSAVAATGVGPFKDLFGSEAATPSAVCAPGNCLPANLGPLGEPFSPSVTRTAARRRAAERAAGTAAERRARGSAPAAGGEGWGGPAGGGSAGSPDRSGSNRNSVAGGGGTPKTGGGSGGASPGGDGGGGGGSSPGGRPDGPGRSEEAPGHNKPHGKPPKGDGHGQSGAAPGKPDTLPGQFGHRNK